MVLRLSLSGIGIARFSRDAVCLEGRMRWLGITRLSEYSTENLAIDNREKLADEGSHSPALKQFSFFFFFLFSPLPRQRRRFLVGAAALEEHPLLLLLSLSLSLSLSPPWCPLDGCYARECCRRGTGALEDPENGGASGKLHRCRQLSVSYKYGWCSSIPLCTRSDSSFL